MTWKEYWENIETKTPISFCCHQTFEPGWARQSIGRGGGKGGFQIADVSGLSTCHFSAIKKSSVIQKLTQQKISVATLLLLAGAGGS